MKKNAKTASAIIIGTILSITLFMSVGETKAAFQRDWSADINGYPNTDYYCECDHTDWQHSDDCMAGLSMTANYWTNYPNGYAYGWINWNWIAQVGYGGITDYLFSGNPYCLGQVMPVNTQTYQTYYQFYNTNPPSDDQYGEYATNAYGVFPWSYHLSSVNGFSSSYFYQISNPSHVIYVGAGPSGWYYQIMTASGPTQVQHVGQSSVEVDATADVAATPTQAYTRGTNPTISWVCADDYGNYYCYITSIVIDGVSHSPNDYGNIYSGSYTFNNIQTAHHVIINSAPYYYPVTIYEYADGYYGEQVVRSWTEYHVAWEERDGPVYSHGSNLNGGGPTNIYCDNGVTDPWDSSYCPFSYAYTSNWNGNSFGVNQYSNPISVWVYTWGITEDVYYQRGTTQTYATTVNAYVTYDGSNYYQAGSYTINEPAGSNYLNFGSNFILAYNYYDGSTHYTNPDWYNLGTGTTINVGFWIGGYGPMGQTQTPSTGLGNQTLRPSSLFPTGPDVTGSGYPTSGIPTSGAAHPPSTPYIYNSTTNTYVPVTYP